MIIYNPDIMLLQLPHTSQRQAVVFIGNFKIVYRCESEGEWLSICIHQPSKRQATSHQETNWTWPNVPTNHRISGQSSGSIDVFTTK